MCYNPITIQTPQGYRTVPCGHCLECLRKYQSDWANRMYEELKAHGGKAVFFTLTYDENNVPKNYLYYDRQGNYEVFRSPSDYGYSNVYTDEKGRERVLQSCGRERKHYACSPDKELRAFLREFGEDMPRIIDFNVSRTQASKFTEKLQNIYGNYLRLTIDDSDSTTSVSESLPCPDWSDYDFSDYRGDDFGELEDMEDDHEDNGQMVHEFTELLNDDDFTGDLHLDCCRQRPVLQVNSVRAKDLQDWIKRARRRREYRAKRYGDINPEFTFFITAEYGPRTLRPHYHGVLFGVTAEETMDMARDWQRHHGQRIQWDNVDLSKGDMSYCAKYCSKGFFEHPLCAKDFFYFHPNADTSKGERPFTEYHSKHYERCMQLFNVDAPIVDKPFKLISKGLGVSYVEKTKDKMLQDFDDIDFYTDTTNTSVEVGQLLAPWDAGFNDPDLEDAGCGFKMRKLKVENNELNTRNYEECIDRLFQRFHYNRTYKDKTYSYGMPKYYRTKMFNEGLRVAFANYVQQVNVELYQEKLGQIQTAYPDWSDMEGVAYLEKQDQVEKACRMKITYDRMKKQYNKSSI